MVLCFRHPKVLASIVEHHLMAGKRVFLPEAAQYAVMSAFILGLLQQEAIDRAEIRVQALASDDACGHAAEPEEEIVSNLGSEVYVVLEVRREEFSHEVVEVVIERRRRKGTMRGGDWRSGRDAKGQHDGKGAREAHRPRATARLNGDFKLQAYQTAPLVAGKINWPKRLVRNKRVLRDWKRVHPFSSRSWIILSVPREWHAYPGALGGAYSKFEVSGDWEAEALVPRHSVPSRSS